VFGSLFGKKKRRSKSSEPLKDDSIRSAGVDDVVVIPGFSPTFEDAYFIVESKNRLESAFGRAYELIAVDGDRRVSIEWHDDSELLILVTEHDETIGLSEIGLDEQTLSAWDDNKSTENFVEFEDKKYFYRTSYEVLYYKDNAGAGEGFWLWDFGNEDGEHGVSVVKWEGMPFEAYQSVIVSPHIVRVYRK
jgi:hypothetical protein